MRPPSGWSVPRVVILQLTLCAALYSLHDVAGITRTETSYTPFSSGVHAPSVIVDESVYAAASRRFALSGRVYSELDVYEARNLNNGYTTVFAPPIGLAARIIGLENVWILIHAFAPAITWLIIFLALQVFLRDVVASSAIAWLTCLVAVSPRNALLIGNGSFIQPLELMRTYNPSISLPLLLLALGAFAWAIRTGRWHRYAIAGVALGIQPYLYYYYGLAAAATPLIAMAALLATGYKRAAAGALTIWVISLIMMAPYLVDALSAKAGMQDHLERVGSFTHAPDTLGIMIALIGAAISIFLLKRRVDAPLDRTTAVALTAMCAIAAAGAGMNAQILTGYNAQHHSHFLNRFIQPVAFASLACWLSLLALRSARWRNATRFTLIAVAGLVIGAAIVRQVSAGRHHARQVDADAERHEVLSWIRAHGGPAVVIATSDAQIISLAPAVAGAWNFVPHYRRSLVTEEEVVLRYLGLLAIEGTSLPAARRRAQTKPVGATDDRLTESVLLKLVDRAGREAVLSAEESSELLKTRKLDFLIVTSRNGAPPLGAWRRVHSTDAYDIFERL